MKKPKDFRPRLKGNILKAYQSITKQEDRILVIGKYSWMLKSTLGEYAETPEDFDIFSDED